MKLVTAMVVLTALTAVACSAFDAETGERATAEGPEATSPPTSSVPAAEAAVEASSPSLESPNPPADTADGGAAARPASACPPASAGDGGACPDGGARWNGRCYFVVPGLVSRLSARSACAAVGASLATFTCAPEWNALVVPSPSNYWIDAAYDAESAAWQWASGEAFGFVPAGGSFVAGPPPIDTKACLLVDQNGRWVPADCGSRAAHALCELP